MSELGDSVPGLPAPSLEPPKKWVLKEMSPMHKHVMSLVAQGLRRHEIADICDITPEYVTMLCGQAVCQVYLREMSAFADSQLEAASEESAQVIIDVLRTGSNEDRLKAARLQMEATQRIGPNRRRSREDLSEDEHLSNLAERLTQLIGTHRESRTLDVVPTDVQTSCSAPDENLAAATESKMGNNNGEV